MDEYEDECWECGEPIDGDVGPVLDADPVYAAQFHVDCVERSSAFWPLDR